MIGEFGSQPIFPVDIFQTPVIAIGMGLIGLIPPYCFDRTLSRILEWQALLSMAAFCTLASLIVIRSCGYRLFRLTTASEHDVAENGEI